MSKEPRADGSHVGRRSIVRVQRLEAVDVLRIGVGCTDKLGQSADDGRDGLGRERGQAGTERIEVVLGALGSQLNGPSRVPLSKRR